EGIGKLEEADVAGRRANHERYFHSQQCREAPLNREMNACGARRVRKRRQLTQPRQDGEHEQGHHSRPRGKLAHAAAKLPEPCQRSGAPATRRCAALDDLLRLRLGRGSGEPHERNRNHDQRYDHRPAQDFEFRRQREYGQAHGEQHDEPDRIEQPVERSGREHARRWHATRTCHEHYARGIASVRYENVVEAGASEGGTHAERQRRRSNGAQQNPPSHATSDQREEVHGERGEQQRTRSRYHGMPRLTPVDFPRKEDQQNDDRGRQREANPPANPTSIHRGNVANVKPRSCSPLTIRGIACAVWVRSPTASYPSPSWRSKMYPARAPWTVLATMASVPGRSVSHTPSDHPTVRSPSERAIAVTHGLRNPWGARKNAGVTPDAPSIAALPRPRSSRTYAIPRKCSFR